MIIIGGGGSGGGGGGGGDWASITGKPSTFPPSSHNHVTGDITDMLDTLSDYSEINHTHTLDAITDVELATGTENDFLVFGDDDIVVNKNPGEVRTITGIDDPSATLFVETPTNGTYYITLDAPFAGTILTARHVLTSGSLSFTATINGANVTGIAAISPTSTPATATASAANTFSEGAVIAVTVSSVSSPSRLAITFAFDH